MSTDNRTTAEKTAPIVAECLFQLKKRDFDAALGALQNLDAALGYWPAGDLGDDPDGDIEGYDGA